MSTEGEWQTSTMRDGRYGSIWRKAWWKRDQKRGDSRRTPRLTSAGVVAYVLQVAPWHPQESARGKFVVISENEGVSITQSPVLPKPTVPHIFDTLEEAQAVYDLITEKD